MTQPVYALSHFNVSSKDEYLAYSRRSHHLFDKIEGLRPVLK